MIPLMTISATAFSIYELMYCTQDQDIPINFWLLKKMVSINDSIVSIYHNCIVFM